MQVAPARTPSGACSAHVRLTQELESLLGRTVDLVNRRAIEQSVSPGSPLRQSSIGADVRMDVRGT